VVCHFSALWDDGELPFSYLQTEFLSFRRRTGERESVSAGYDNRGQVFFLLSLLVKRSLKGTSTMGRNQQKCSHSQSSVTTGEQFLSQHPLSLLSSRTGELSSSLLSSRTGELSSSLLSTRTGELSSSQQLSSHRDYRALVLV
jgi:hypothetical protein